MPVNERISAIYRRWHPLKRLRGASKKKALVHRCLSSTMYSESRAVFFSFEQRKAEPFVRHNCFVAIPPVCCRSRQHRHYRSRTPVRQPFLALASLGSPAGRLAGQLAPLRYGAIALCSQVDSRLSGSGGTIITRYTKSLPGSILHSRQRS